MGEDVHNRRKFIEDNALDVKNLDVQATLPEERRRVESLLRRALIFAAQQEARFVLFAGVFVKREAPAVLVADVA